MKKLIVLLTLFMVSQAHAAAPDRRISDADGDVLNINSDGTIPVSLASGVGGADNSTAVACDESIEDAVTAATAGDVLLLGSCTYTITDDIDVTKVVHLVGQGIDATTIASSTAAKNLIEITADGSSVSNLTVSNTGAGTSTGIRVDGSAGTVFSDVVLNNVKVVMNGTGSQIAIDYRDAGGTLRDVEVSSTSSNANGTGIRLLNLSTAEAPTILNGYRILVNNSNGGSTGNGLSVLDSTATQDATFNLYGCRVVTTETAAATSQAIDVNGTDAFANLHDCYMDGNDLDLSITNSGNLTVYPPTILANNNVTSGAINWADGTEKSVPTQFAGVLETTIGTSRHTQSGQNGKNLTITAGGAGSGTTDGDGGDLILTGGKTTGTGTSSIKFKVYHTDANSGTSKSCYPSVCLNLSSI